MKFTDIKDIAQKRNMNFIKCITDSSMVSLFDKNCNYVEQAKLAKGVLSFNGKNYRTLESVNSLIDEILE